MKKILSAFLVICMLVALYPINGLAATDSTFFDAFPDSVKTPGLSNFIKSSSYKDGQFSDVPSSAWYAGVVKTVFELELMNGSSATTFNPSGNITIAETLAVACRLHQIYNGGTGEFLQGTPWYQVYVDYAIGNGIITADQFGDYTVAAKRSDFAVIVAASLPQTALQTINSIISIPDVPNEASYSEAVYLLYKAGVLTGNDQFGTFNPDSNIARSEAAAIVARMAVSGERKSYTLQAESSTPSADGKIALTPDNYRNYISFDVYIDKLDIDNQFLGYLGGTCQVELQSNPKQAVSFENVTVRFYLESSSTGWTNLGNPKDGYDTFVVSPNGITSRKYSITSLIDQNLDKTPAWRVRVIAISGYVILPNN